MDNFGSSRLEDRRQIEHLAPIVFAFLLPYLPFSVILSLGFLSLIYALYVSPHLLKVTTRQEEAGKGYSPGKFFYASSILLLLILLRNQLYIVAGVWGILSVGDALSNVMGRRYGHRRLPYNPHKTWIGSLAFVASGTLAGSLLIFWNQSPEAIQNPLDILLFSFITSVACAAAESLPPVLDDNLTVPWVGATTLYLLFSIPNGANLQASWVDALAVNAVAAALVGLLGWLSRRAIVLAIIYGFVVYLAAGLQGFLTVGLFLCLGSLATAAGFQAKKALSVEQGTHGERGISNILANGVVPLAAACFHLWIPSEILRIAFVAAVATATFDTVATEIGQWIGGRPYDPVRLRSVPVGTKGAVSLEGTAVGLLGATLIAVLPAAMHWLPWASVPLVITSAAAASFFESILAARFRFSFQYSDEALNLYSTLLGATSACYLWKFLL